MINKEKSDKDKIKEYLTFKGITKNAFCTKMGYSNKFLESGKSLGVDKLREIASIYTDLSIEWLVLNQGPMIKSPDSARKVLHDSSLFEEQLDIYEASKEIFEIRSQIREGNYKQVEKLGSVAENLLELYSKAYQKCLKLADFIQKAHNK